MNIFETSNNTKRVLWSRFMISAAFFLLIVLTIPANADGGYTWHKIDKNGYNYWSQSQRAMMVRS